MNLKRSIPLVTTDAEIADSFVRALEASERLAPAGTCRNLVELTARLGRNPAPAAVVDIGPGPMQMLAELGPIIPKFSDTRFVLLSREVQNELLVEAMEIGVRYVMDRKALDPELVGVLQRLMPNSVRRAGGSGLAITVLSASGGCGATTIAVNLANELRLEVGEPTLLVDLDASYGAIGAYLGLKGNYGIADALAHGDRVDAQLVRSSASEFTEDLHVLLSPANLGSQTRTTVQYENLGHALEACKQAYSHTVIDAPRVPVDVGCCSVGRWGLWGRGASSGRLAAGWAGGG